MVHLIATVLFALALPAQVLPVWPFPTSSPTPAPAPSPQPAPSPSTAPVPAPTGPAPQSAAQKQLIDQARASAGSSLADALAVQFRVGQSLDENGKGQDAFNAELGQNDRESKRLTAEIAARQPRIESTRRQVEVDRRRMAVLARAISRQPDSILMRLLEAGSLHEALVAGADTMVAARRATRLHDQLQAELRQLDQAQRDQQADLARRQQLAAEQAGVLQRLRDLQGQQQQLSGQLADLVARTNAELHQLDGQSPDLALRIAGQLQAEEAQLSATAERLTWAQVGVWQQANPTFAVPPSAAHSRHSRFIWPIPNGVVTQEFGPTDFALEPSYAGFAHFHTGIDVAAPMGTPVLAADDGIVVTAVRGATGYGNYVVLAHNDGFTTLYGHLEQPLVAAGDRVTQGQAIGLEGSTGASTGPHCHFEVRTGGQPVNPRSYLPPGAPSGSRP
jgi:murein DD-endopeptidase MepM/ murein hydrolase activator NlpD